MKTTASTELAFGGCAIGQNDLNARNLQFLKGHARGMGAH